MSFVEGVRIGVVVARGDLVCRIAQSHSGKHRIRVILILRIGIGDLACVRLWTVEMMRSMFAEGTQHWISGIQDWRHAHLIL